MLCHSTASFGASHHVGHSRCQHVSDQTIDDDHTIDEIWYDMGLKYQGFNKSMGVRNSQNLYLFKVISKQ